MNKYSVITINLAGVNPGNTGAIISNGVEFTMDEGSYYMEFMPTSLIQAKK